MTTKKYFDSYNINDNSYNKKDVYIYELSNDKLKVGITDFGAAIQYLKVKSKGKEYDVCLGYNSVKEYLASGTYCGATIGRVGNRIKKGTFILNGEKYNLTINDGENHLHGGLQGYDRQFFDVKEKENSVEMSYLDKDQSQGYGGNLKFSVTFSLEDYSLKITYNAVCDKDTPFAPTCHAYFNLNGGGFVYNNLLRINACKFTEADEHLIPTGVISSVTNTPFDFTMFKTIGRDINADNRQLKFGGGYDHNFVLSGEHAATAIGDESGIQMDLYTDLPGLQFYSGNFIKGVGKNGELKPRHGFCLEPQFFPDAVNNASFPSPVIKAGQEVCHYIKYDFKTQ